MKIALGILWLLAAVTLFQQLRERKWPFTPHAPERHLRELLHKKTVQIAQDWPEAAAIDDALAEWRLPGPVVMALPPMYRANIVGNAGFVMSFVNHGEALLYNGPYPHPKLEIVERFAGPSNLSAYAFDNRATNACLGVGVRGRRWPSGFTAWYDLVMRRHTVWVKTPHLVDAGGNRISPAAVHTIHPFNEVTLSDEWTAVRLGHQSPVVWIFPSEGRLEKPDPGFNVEEIADGAGVSWLPPLPGAGNDTVALFLLAPRVAPTVEWAPPWWPIDERFRRAVVDGYPVAERRALLTQLARAFPTHPLLPHYRVIAELGGDHFDEAWMAAQKESCQLPSWYLVAWSKLPWSRVHRLPCLAKLPATGALDIEAEYIAESVVLAFRQLRDDPELLQLADRVAAASYLRDEFRGFNYAPSDFAWLWRKARP
jgi:hypothetical protein